MMRVRLRLVFDFPDGNDADTFYLNQDYMDFVYKYRKRTSSYSIAKKVMGL